MLQKVIKKKKKETCSYVRELCELQKLNIISINFRERWRRVALKNYFEYFIEENECFVSR